MIKFKIQRGLKRFYVRNIKNSLRKKDIEIIFGNAGPWIEGSSKKPSGWKDTVSLSFWNKGYVNSLMQEGFGKILEDHQSIRYEESLLK